MVDVVANTSVAMHGCWNRAVPVRSASPCRRGGVHYIRPPHFSAGRSRCRMASVPRAIRESGGRTTAVSRIGEFRQGHLAVQQFAGRAGVRRARDLRHDAAHRAGRVDAVYGVRCQHGNVFLLAAGSQGKRYALPNARIVIHQSSRGGEALRPTSRFRPGKCCICVNGSTRRWPNGTGQTVAQIGKDSDCDCFMSAHQAKVYGLIHDVLAQRDGV